MSKVEEKHREKFAAVTNKTFEDQARWFLNGFWQEVEKDAEHIWKLAHKCMELDDRKKKGNDLDEFNAHRFLEFLGETLTVKEMRDKLREIDVDFNKRMALTEYLMFKYSKNVSDIVNARQGENKEEIDQAQAKVAQATAAVEAMNLKLEEQMLAVKNHAAAQTAASLALKAAKKAEEDAIKAEEEQKASLDELQKREDEYKKSIAELEKKSQEGSTVAKGRAIQELETLKAEDPLPLRRAKITQESSVRKSEKARKFAESERAKAAESADAAAAAHKAAEESAKQVAAAVAEAEAKFKDALQFLEEAKAKPGSSNGDIWWMQRDIAEKKKYLPKSKQ